DRHREERRTAVHTRSPAADRTGAERSGAPHDSAHSRRGASVRGDVPPPRACHARPAFRARSCAGYWSAPPPHAAHDVWQSRGRATRHARGAGGHRRRQSRGCCPCVFREPAVTCDLLLDINFAQIFIAFIVLLFSLTVHEMAHAWTADRLGDPTARLLGRVSLNPVVHADLVGTIVFPLAAMLTGVPLIGWATPVPVNVRRLRHQRRDY